MVQISRKNKSYSLYRCTNDENSRRTFLKSNPLSHVAFSTLISLDYEEIGRNCSGAPWRTNFAITLLQAR